MKTPKQEAEDLIREFEHPTEYVYLQRGVAKYCATIAAKKLMQSTLSKLWYIHNNVEVRDNFYYEYWEQVLKEIEIYEP
jgi:hypothetical protein